MIIINIYFLFTCLRAVMRTTRMSGIEARNGFIEGL